MALVAAGVHRRPLSFLPFQRCSTTLPVADFTPYRAGHGVSVLLRFTQVHTCIHTRAQPFCTVMDMWCRQVRAHTRVRGLSHTCPFRSPCSSRHSQWIVGGGPPLLQTFHQ